jgi:HIV Tat-specific factor 1
MMNGRWFSQQRLEAYIASGDEKFKKSKAKKGGDEDEEAERLDEFGDWLEQGHDDKLGDEIR